MDYIDTVLIGQAAARAAGGRSGAPTGDGDATYWKAYAEAQTTRIAQLQTELQQAKDALLRKNAESDARRTYGRVLREEIVNCPHPEHHPVVRDATGKDGNETSVDDLLLRSEYEKEMAKVGVTTS